MIFRKKQTIKNKGFTLIEALVGVTIFAIVFFGIFGAYRLGLKVIGVSKNKIVATALANSRIEEIKNLTYESAGLVDAVLPMAEGILEQEIVKTINGVDYTIETKIQFVTDSEDGFGAADNCNWDYKKADVTVTWQDSFAGQLTVSAAISPKNAVQEAQTCLSQPGGILTVTVFDSTGALVLSPTISVYEEATSNLIDTAVPSSGKHSFTLPVGTYRVEVDKSGYGNARTYSTAEVAVPDSPNPAVLNGDATEMSLMTDQNSTLVVDGAVPNGHDNFGDTFSDQSLISDIFDAQVVSGAVLIAGPAYSEDGYVISNSVAPSDLVSWDYAEFTDHRPASTDIKYQILYFDGADWTLVPEGSLGGNTIGFGSSPINLSGLDKNIYSQLKIKGTLLSNDPLATPEIRDWRISWTNDTSVPIGDVAFNLLGSKTIGKNGAGETVYKYSANHILDASGHLDIEDIEGDAYTIAVDPSEGLSLIGIDPSPQPINAVPGSVVPVKLFLRAQNALLATVENDVTLGPVFSASIRLQNASLGYDKTQYTNEDGQTYFAPLQNGVYDLTVSLQGYTDYSGTATVSGETAKIISIQQNE
ncbi:MAG TPA: prepilin-type N-terminal cleavage/methylation domain-containing protein [Candidatus Paceibacterota bacterium]|nr:prepilin-type N-terminal cleavage/methylation domain-containing protein [Candidatus Pacearchaeota archaeon]HRZ51310.1 prepilin-type N-terminal cleavage/methylation domain-containing protein [Candidatus Paceibacterota bacterium]HSA37032.1 prepilin-type N-terminal cleavage/methylation domain-containing protein [Candidatus Paceibacterota bacterium]